MDRRTLCEGVVLAIISFTSLFEAIRLIRFQHNDRVNQYDAVGPGYYILLFGLLLLIVTIIYVVSNYGKTTLRSNASNGHAMKSRAIGMAAGFGLYSLIMYVGGYLIATLFFFLFEFRVVGINSWKTIVIISVVMTMSYYFIFIWLCEMVFPHGILFS